MVAKGTGMTSPRKSTEASTTVFLVGLVLTYIALPSDSAGGVFAGAAVGIGLSLATATMVEATSGVRALIRVDILMLWALYGLTFLEFLFPQPDVENLISPDVATKGVIAAILGFAGLAIGRHIVPRRRKSNVMFFADVPPRKIFLLFIIATMLGYLHILLAVNFDLLEMFRQMALPRFAQSWSRGRYGDFSALLTEIGALIYLIPPIAGLVFARLKTFSAVQKLIVTIILLITIYYGFSSGTRHILTVYVFTFFGAYYLTKSEIKSWRVMAQAAVILVVLLLVTSYMLEFRDIGIGDFSFPDRSPKTLYIDHNMVVLSQLTDAFPARYEFLGLEIPYEALIHPIPRALWPGKPLGFVGIIEAVVGVDAATTTIACTFVGEAYMMGGMLGVVFVSILFGAAAEMWNRVREDTNSAFAQLLYTSGFLCAAIGMRSMLWVTVTMLPTLALWLYGRMWLVRRHRVPPPPPKQS